MVEGMFNQTNYLLACRLMDAAVLRHEALASNVANVETKGYKRVDIDRSFNAQLRSAVNNGDKRRMEKISPRLVVDETARNVRGDGNNVELDTELMAMSNNALEHEFLTQYLTNSYNHLRAAIAGRAD
jgi:flagellar basal-body rod protein FlgB